MPLFIRLGKASMATTIYVVVSVGFVMLLAATLTLVVLNWSEKTLAPALSILLVGTVTTLATVLVTLKESSIENAFSTSVVLDVTDRAPLFINPEPTNPKLTSRLSDLSSLGRPVVNRDGKTVLTIEKPANDDERFRFTGELVQYQLVRAIQKLQRGGWTAGMFFGGSAATISTPMKLSNTQDYPKEVLLADLANNRFSNSDMERSRWEHSSFPLPKKTSLRLVHLAGGPNIGTEKYVVRLEKPMYFQIDFTVEPLLATGIGVLPNGLVLAPEMAARCQTYQLKITMKATFEKITAGNAYTQEYKDWAAWLFSNLRDSVGD